MKDFLLFTGVIVLAIVLLFAGSCGCAAGCNRIVYSEGIRYGSIVKFSERGLIWKTWEGELVRSGDGIAVMDSWSFTVTAPDLVEAVSAAARSGARVALHYEERAAPLLWKGDTSYYIQSVELLEEGPQ